MLTKFSAFALAGFVALGTVSAGVGLAEARTFTEEEYINQDRCYQARRVPALVEYNTRGQQVAPSSRQWLVRHRDGERVVVDAHLDPVYIQTRRVVEEQHVTLVPVDC